MSENDLPDGVRINGGKLHRRKSGEPIFTRCGIRKKGGDLIQNYIPVREVNPLDRCKKCFPGSAR